MTDNIQESILWATIDGKTVEVAEVRNIKDDYSNKNEIIELGKKNMLQYNQNKQRG